ncbi:arylesterase [Hahella sp. CR1]|uniref:arylesterase n=1 Tax=Hahella sp. CR1 TaxID=2992807 RepID=UPI002442A978|nr:arylesterase [Hahella sp. CR1]MDG9668534.1 arylesterase [Hahella sp. CR1]
MLATSFLNLFQHHVIKSIWTLFALCCLMVSPIAQAVTDKSQPVKIVVLGDSLSAAYGIPLESGWITLMENELRATHPNLTLINASISGETTGGGRARLSALLKDHKPDIVLLELGGNDGLRGFPLNIIKNNLAAMLESIAEAGAKAMLIGMRIPPNYGPAYAEGFHQIYQDLASEQKVTLVPFLLDNVALDPSLMQSDGIHPNAKGQPQLVENVLPHLNSLLSH